MKSLDDMKTDFKHFKFTRKQTMQGDSSGAAEEYAGLRTVMDSVKKLDRSDQRYILNKKILPVALGIVILTLLLTFLQIPNLIVLTGFFLVYAGLVSILILFLRDYRNIINETFDQTLRDYLESKRKRLVQWNRIPVLYHMIYGFYVTGVLLIIMGSTPLADFLGTSHGHLIYALGIIAALVASGMVGEFRFRKRHQKMHRPILERIDSLLSELRSNGDLT